MGRSTRAHPSPSGLRTLETPKRRARKPSSRAAAADANRLAESSASAEQSADQKQPVRKATRSQNAVRDDSAESSEAPSLAVGEDLAAEELDEPSATAAGQSTVQTIDLTDESVDASTTSSVAGDEQAARVEEAPAMTPVPAATPLQQISTFSTPPTQFSSAASTFSPKVTPAQPATEPAKRAASSEQQTPRPPQQFTPGQSTNLSPLPTSQSSSAQRSLDKGKNTAVEVSPARSTTNDRPASSHAEQISTSSSRRSSRGRDTTIDTYGTATPSSTGMRRSRDRNAEEQPTVRQQSNSMAQSVPPRMSFDFNFSHSAASNTQPPETNRTFTFTASANLDTPSRPPPVQRSATTQARRAYRAAQVAKRQATPKPTDLKARRLMNREIRNTLNRSHRAPRNETAEQKTERLQRQYEQAVEDLQQTKEKLGSLYSEDSVFAQTKQHRVDLLAQGIDPDDEDTSRPQLAQGFLARAIRQHPDSIPASPSTPSVRRSTTAPQIGTVTQVSDKLYNGVNTIVQHSSLENARQFLESYDAWSTRGETDPSPAASRSAETPEPQDNGSLTDAASDNEDNSEEQATAETSKSSFENFISILKATPRKLFGRSLGSNDAASPKKRSHKTGGSAGDAEPSAKRRKSSPTGKPTPVPAPVSAPIEDEDLHPEFPPLQKPTRWPAPQCKWVQMKVYDALAIDNKGSYGCNGWQLEVEDHHYDQLRWFEVHDENWKPQPELKFFRKVKASLRKEAGKPADSPRPSTQVGYSTKRRHASAPGDATGPAKRRRVPSPTVEDASVDESAAQNDSTLSAPVATAPQTPAATAGSKKTLRFADQLTDPQPLAVSAPTPTDFSSSLFGTSVGAPSPCPPSSSRVSAARPSGIMPPTILKPPRSSAAAQTPVKIPTIPESTRNGLQSAPAAATHLRSTVQDTPPSAVSPAIGTTPYAPRLPSSTTTQPLKVDLMSGHENYVLPHKQFPTGRIPRTVVPASTLHISLDPPALLPLKSSQPSEEPPLRSPAQMKEILRSMQGSKASSSSESVQPAESPMTEKESTNGSNSLGLTRQERVVLSIIQSIDGDANTSEAGSNYPAGNNDTGSESSRRSSATPEFSLATSSSIAQPQVEQSYALNGVSGQASQDGVIDSTPRQSTTLIGVLDQYIVDTCGQHSYDAAVQLEEMQKNKAVPQGQSC